MWRPAQPIRIATTAAAALVAALLLVVACTGQADDTPATTPTAATVTPAATPVPTPTATPQTRFSGVDGRTLFGQACAACHGQALEGTDRGPTFLDRIYAPGHHADFAFMSAIARGVRSHHWSFGNMAPVEGLTNDQVLAIIGFIREQQRAVGIE